MKNIKKLGLVSFLACASLAGGIMMANTEAPEVEKYFRMEAGAQVRVPDVVEDEYVKDGLRFVAKMSDSFWQEKGKEKDLSVGMFIMPAAYASKPINYDNCFGESACYYWEGVEAKTENAKEILHVESYAYEEEPGADYLTMKASIWNMNAENLDKEFVAVAYLTDGTNYWFAETAQGAKTVSVAQKALLNKKDPIYAEDPEKNAPALVESEYINKYIDYKGGSVEVSYTESVYKQNKDLTYSLVEENVQKTATVTAYNTQAPAIMENYSFVDGWSTKNRALLFDGTTALDSYYNYSANRAVIWDGETVDNYDSTYMDAYSKAQTVMTKESGNFEGASLRLYLTDGFDGPAWSTGFTLPASTNTLSMNIEVGLYNGQASKQPGFNNFYLYHTAKNNYVQPVKYTIVNLDTYETTVVDRNGGDFDLLTGRYYVTMEFAQEFSTIYCLCYHVWMGDSAPMYVDNICAQNIVKADGFSVPYTFADTVSFNAPQVIDTNCWDGEKSSVTVSYKAEGADSWSDLTAENGIYSFAATEGVARYDVKLVAGETEIVRTTIKGTIWADYDTSVTEREYVVANTYNNTGLWDDKDNSSFYFELTGFEGKFISANVKGAWVYTHAKADIANKTFEAINGGVAPTKLGAWIYASKAMSFNCGANIWGQFGYGVGTIELQAGYHYYEIGMPAGWGTKFANCAFVFNYCDYYVDAVVVY